MEKINCIESPVFVLNYENIDTDQIIPAGFLKATSRDGLGKAAFYNWRYNSDGSENPKSVFKERKAGSEILLAGKNFGCGSSREHAVWALQDYGFKVVISSYFADIFKNNALNNGLLVITVSETFLHELMAVGDGVIKVKLATQSVENQTTGNKETFEINGFKKECMLNGYAPIDYLLSIGDKIEEYENERTL